MSEPTKTRRTVLWTFGILGGVLVMHELVNGRRPQLRSLLVPGTVLIPLLILESREPDLAKSLATGLAGTALGFWLNESIKAGPGDRPARVDDLIPR